MPIKTLPHLVNLQRLNENEPVSSDDSSDELLSDRVLDLFVFGRVGRRHEELILNAHTQV